jgi:hypothetical protein
LIGVGFAFVVLGGVLFTGLDDLPEAVTVTGPDDDCGTAAVAPTPAAVAPAGTAAVSFTGAAACTPVDELDGFARASGDGVAVESGCMGVPPPYPIGPTPTVGLADAGGLPLDTLIVMGVLRAGPIDGPVLPPTSSGAMELRLEPSAAPP